MAFIPIFYTIHICQKVSQYKDTMVNRLNFPSHVPILSVQNIRQSNSDMFG